MTVRIIPLFFVWLVEGLTADGPARAASLPTRSPPVYKERYDKAYDLYTIIISTV